MTDITKAQVPQGATGDAVDRKPWKAPRLIDLDEDESEGRTVGNIMATINDKVRGPGEGTRDLGDIILHHGES